MKTELCEFRWLRLPYSRVRKVMLDHPVRLIQPAADTALQHSVQVLTTLDVDVGRRHLEKDVTVSVGDIVDIKGPLPILKLPVRWHATSRPGLYPVMDGTLEAYPISGDRTQLSMQGHYQPPFGKLGQVIDGLVLHRIAEESVEHFLEHVADRIAATATGAPAPEPPMTLVEPEADEPT